MFEIAEKLGSFLLFASCKDAASSEAMLPPCGTGKKLCSLTGKKKNKTKTNGLFLLVLSVKLKRTVLCLGRKVADELRICWEGAGIGVPTPSLLILRKKYIVFDILLFISHSPAFFFFFLSFSRTGHLPTVLQEKLAIFIKFHGLSSCKKQKKKDSLAFMLCGHKSLHKELSHWLRADFCLVSEATLLCEIHKGNLQNLWVHAQLVWANSLENTRHFYAQEIKTGHRETITLTFKKGECLTWNLQYLISVWNNAMGRFGCVWQEDANQYHQGQLLHHGRSHWLKSKIQIPHIFTFFLSLMASRADLQSGEFKGGSQKMFVHGGVILLFLLNFIFPELLCLSREMGY